MKNKHFKKSQLLSFQLISNGREKFERLGITQSQISPQGGAQLSISKLALAVLGPNMGPSLRFPGSELDFEPTRCIFP